jgi:hypothetical protein
MVEATRISSAGYPSTRQRRLRAAITEPGTKIVSVIAYPLTPITAQATDLSPVGERYISTPLQTAQAHSHNLVQILKTDKHP